MRQDRDVLVTCTQEEPLFREVAAEDDPEAGLAFANLREKALWSHEAKQAHPKMAALVAEAALDLEPTPTVAMESAGTCLIYGRDETAIELARQLSDKLDVTVLLAEPGEIMPPRQMDVPVFKGRIRELRGHFGGFGVTVDDYAPALPAARQSLRFELGRNGAFSECDIVIDVTGDDPLVRAPDKRDGYLRAAPDDPARVQRIAFQAADLVGTFEKPKYVAYDPSICAHGRSRKTGCTNCLDACPTGAIQSLGETVEIDPYVCAGCGSCASVCPTGAASYNLPRAFDLFERLRTLIGGYLKAGGKDPVLLIHDAGHGEEQIAMMARYGRGLPARVLPLAVSEVTQIGLDALAGAFGYGAARVVFLVPPSKRREGELNGLETQIATMDAILSGMGYGEERITLVEDADPDAAEAQLWDLDKPAAPEPGTFLGMGGKRSRTLLGPAPPAHTRPRRAGHRAAAPGRAVRPGACRHAGLHDVSRLRPRVSHRRDAGRPGQPLARLQRGGVHPVRPVRRHLPGGRDHPGAAPQSLGGRAQPDRAEPSGAVPLRALRQAVRRRILDPPDRRPAGRKALDVPTPRPGRTDHDVRRLPRRRAVRKRRFAVQIRRGAEARARRTITSGGVRAICKDARRRGGSPAVFSAIAPTRCRPSRFYPYGLNASRIRRAWREGAGAGRAAASGRALSGQIWRHPSDALRHGPAGLLRTKSFYSDKTTASC